MLYNNYDVIISIIILLDNMEINIVDRLKVSHWNTWRIKFEGRYVLYFKM